MTWLLHNFWAIAAALNGIGMTAVVIYSCFTKSDECPTCRQRRLWKEGWDADTVLRNDPRM